MSRHEYKNYDDDAVLREIILGEKTYEQIGRDQGLSATQVSRIALGQARPELQERLEAAIQGFYEQSRRLGARLLPMAVRRLAAIIAGQMDAPADVQRQAAVDVIHLTVGHLGPRDRGSEGSGVLDMVTIECSDGVLALSADAFEERARWPDGGAGGRLSTNMTRAEYLRLIASRTEKGGPEVFSRREDHDTYMEILVDRGTLTREDIEELDNEARQAGPVDPGS